MTEPTLTEALRRVQALGGCPATGKPCRTGRVCICEDDAKEAVTAARKRNAVDPDARFLRGMRG